MDGECALTGLMLGIGLRCQWSNSAFEEERQGVRKRDGNSPTQPQSARRVCNSCMVRAKG